MGENKTANKSNWTLTPNPSVPLFRRVESNCRLTQNPSEKTLGEISASGQQHSVLHKTSTHSHCIVNHKFGYHRTMVFPLITQRKKKNKNISSNQMPIILKAFQVPSLV